MKKILVQRACMEDPQKAIIADGQRAGICTKHLNRMHKTLRDALTLDEPRAFERCMVQVSEEKWVDTQRDIQKLA